MKYTKLLLLLAFVFILSTSAFAMTHQFIFDGEGPSSDILIGNGLVTFMIQNGQTSESLLQNEVSEIQQDRITISINYGEASISYPQQYATLAEKTATFLLENYDIQAKMVNFDEQTNKEEVKEIMDVMIPKKNRFFERLQLSRPVIIRGTGDLESGEAAGRAYKGSNGKSPEEVKETDLLENDVYIIGGPCANSQWGQFSERSCDNWGLGKGQGMVKIMKNGARRVILIAGTTAKDTKQLTEMFFSGELDSRLKEGKEIIIYLI